jgi:hypothetical protein
MPTVYQNVSWLNHNAARHYPLADDADGVDNSGSFTLPTDFLLELDLPVHAGMDVDPARFFLKHLGAYATGYFISIGYQPTGDDPDDAVDVATCLVPRTTHTENRMYALGGVEPFEDTSGKVVIGKLDNIDKEPAGFWTFTLAQGRLDPDAVRPMIRGISSIIVVNGTEESQPLYGDIVLESGQNIQLLVSNADSGTPTIRLNAINGEGLTEECICEGEEAPRSPIYTINGVAPRLDGELTLVSGDCLTFEAITNGLRMTNTCSKPCCNCVDLERITRDLERFGEQVAAVISFSTELRSTVSVMDRTVLGSRLGDRGCIVGCE